MAAWRTQKAALIIAAVLPLVCCSPVGGVRKASDNEQWIWSQTDKSDLVRASGYILNSDLEAIETIKLASIGALVAYSKAVMVLKLASQSGWLIGFDFTLQDTVFEATKIVLRTDAKLDHNCDLSKAMFAWKLQSYHYKNQTAASLICRHRHQNGTANQSSVLYLRLDEFEFELGRKTPVDPNKPEPETPARDL